MKKCSVFLVFALLCLFVMPVMAEANQLVAGAGGSMVDALVKIINFLKGPFAIALMLVMIICGFCAIAFVGADIGGWVRWMAYMAILAGMLGSAPKILDWFGFDSTMLM